MRIVRKSHGSRSRSTLLPVLFGFSACGLLGETSLAGTLKTADSYGYNTLGGGEFKVTSFTGGSYSPLGPNVPDVRNTPAKFQTFCVEFNEHLQHGVTYFWDLNTGAVAGGPGGGQNLSTWYGGHGTGDPLDPKTGLPVFKVLERHAEQLRLRSEQRP
jgi:hypothetical protein